MFDIFAHLLSSIASFLFPLFASYKALKTSDPAQLTPWLMYWVVLACALLVESWTEWILVWIPFYAYIRLFFLLYLVLPQTQGARIIYQTHVHPFLQDNEAQIEEFISEAHDRLKAAGIAYLKRAIEAIKTNVLGLPPSEPEPTPQPAAASAPQSYTQSLLARFSVPTARWTPTAHTGADFYNLLAGAVSAATGAAGGNSSHQDLTKSGSLIPPELQGGERTSFIAAQRERLAFLLKVLEREAAATDSHGEASGRAGSLQLDGNEEELTQRPASAHSGLSKSRSETDFEKIDAESGAEDQDEGDGTVRRRQPGGSSWMPWGWGSTPTAENPEGGSSSSVQK
ncbi:Receptor expression-enhancing protein 2 [Colletotrichum truncatum]|uniref:Receptor expression-enhancing protein 2 n=1 Tax=Colletotrichum truncatum TaxID=5467 RepID=A0ACC3YQ50_COLTU|nr:Receptor expression-enhancing protein 2 [Colletotrichum truncatum]KAF6796700.1 Receptor expression-enhancing protein 2 [Colletotrichum truncatum]